MDYTDLLYEVDGPAAVITLNRPERMNALTARTNPELKDALARADADPEVVGVILTGAGRAFCAGADMGMLNSVANEGYTPRHEAPAMDVNANYEAGWAFPLATQKPLIAAVNGAAVGGGMIYSLFCDIRFASEQARFGTAFAAIGLIAEHGISWILPRLIGTANALDLLYSARVIGAQEALEMGLVSRVVPHEDLLPAARDYIGYLARRTSPGSMRTIKRLVYDAQFSDLANAAAAADQAMVVSLAGDDFKEGIRAFGEKRDPRFPRIGA